MAWRGKRWWRLSAVTVSLATTVSLAITGAAGARPLAHAARHRRPVLATDFGPPKVRPHTIDWTGDGSGLLGRLPSYYRAVGKRPGFLDWTVWTRTHAAGYGTVWIKSCVPDCASSPFYSYAARVTAGRVIDHHFTRVTLYYTQQGQAVVARLCIRPPYYEGYGFVMDGRCQ